MLKILFFGQLREILQTDQLVVDIHETGKVIKNVAELREVLRLKGELWDEYLPSSRSLVAVNQTLCDEFTLLHDNDEVALFPPVTGG